MALINMEWTTDMVTLAKNHHLSGFQNKAAITSYRNFGEVQHMPIVKDDMADHYQAFFAHAPSSLFVLTQEGVIVETNIAASRMLGLDPKMLFNKPFISFIAEESKQNWNQHFALSQKNSFLQSCELTLSHPGLNIPHVSAHCVGFQPDETTTFVLVTLEKTAHSKQTDDALRIAAAAFETQNAIIIIDANKAIIQVNGAFCQISGFVAEDVLGKTPLFNSKNPKYSNRRYTLWDDAFKNGYWQGECWNNRKNGEVYPIWLTITAVPIDDGNASHYVCSFIDITAHKQAEKILLEARTNLESRQPASIEATDATKKELAEINNALIALLKYREPTKAGYQQKISEEVQETILPLIKKLKSASGSQDNSSQLLNAIEVNLLQLVSAFGNSDNVPAELHRLTPHETKIAAMVKQGMSSKTIAQFMNISIGTVGIHRNNIRRKLKLNRKSDNLEDYLNTLTD